MNKEGHETPLAPVDPAGVEPTQMRAPSRASEHPRVSQGQVVAVSVQPPGSAEAQLLQGLPPEHLRRAIDGNVQIQLRHLDLQAKELEQSDADRGRAHQQAMKLIDLKGENDRGLRRLAIVVVCGIATFVGFAVYHQKFEMAEKIVYTLTAALAGYVAGRAHQKMKPEKPEQ